MAKAIKGCMNPECSAFTRRVKYKADDKFCKHCGEVLSFVCKDCWMELDDDSRKYCIRCENVRRDNREQMGKVIFGKIGTGASAVGGFAVKTGKKTVNIAANTIDKIKK